MKLATVPKTILLTVLSVSCVVLTSFLDFGISLHAFPGLREPAVKKVVIDPGHGGKDPGCLGSHTVEKDIALSIGLELGELIRQYFPDVEVIFTRKTDVFVPLDKRAKIANSEEADLFISIHCNTIGKRNLASGSETYVMGLHRAKENLMVAKRENSAILMEDDYIMRYDGYDPDSPEGHIILSMYQNAYLEQSILFADCVEKQFSHGLARKSRGVKQAGFLVLRMTAMPSVLIEAGFLSHDDDESFLAEKPNHARMARAIFNAFSEYKAQMDGYIPEDGMPVIPIDELIADATAKPPVRTPQTTQTTQTTQTREAPLATRVSLEITSEDKPDPVSEDEKKEALAGSGYLYYVQLAASRAELPEGKKPWMGATPVEMRREDGYYKYLAGPFTEAEQAKAMQNQLRSDCCKDAFAVAYRGEKRIPFKDAVATIGK